MMEILKPNTSEAEWLAVGKKLSRDRESSAFLLGDWINQGIETYGKTAAYKLAAKAIRKSQRALYLLSHVARAFVTARRVPDLSFQHHAVVAKFPTEIVDELLREAVSKNWTCKQLRRTAEERCGVQKPNGHRKYIKVSLSEQSIADLKEHAPGKKVNWIVTEIVEDYLRGKGFVVPERPSTAERREHWEADGKCRSCGSKPADDGHRNCADCRAKNAERQRKAPEPIKAAEPVPEPAKPTQEAVAPAQAVPAADAEDKQASRPTYAERREAQLAAGAKPIASKKRCTCKIRVLWTECRPKEFIQDDEGHTVRFKEPFKPTCFKTEERAAAANEVYAACHGYREQVVYCASCGAFHLKHIYAVDTIALQEEQELRRKPLRTPIACCRIHHADIA